MYVQQSVQTPKCESGEPPYVPCDREEVVFRGVSVRLWGLLENVWPTALVGV